MAARTWKTFYQILLQPVLPNFRFALHDFELLQNSTYHRKQFRELWISFWMAINSSNENDCLGLMRFQNKTFCLKFHWCPTASLILAVKSELANWLCNNLMKRNTSKPVWIVNTFQNHWTETPSRTKNGNYYIVTRENRETCSIDDQLNFCKRIWNIEKRVRQKENIFCDDNVNHINISAPVQKLW